MSASLKILTSADVASLVDGADNGPTVFAGLQIHVLKRQAPHYLGPRATLWTASGAWVEDDAVIEVAPFIAAQFGENAIIDLAVTGHLGHQAQYEIDKLAGVLVRRGEEGQARVVMSL